MFFFLVFFFRSVVPSSGSPSKQKPASPHKIVEENIEMTEIRQEEKADNVNNNANGTDNSPEDNANATVVEETKLEPASANEPLRPSLRIGKPLSFLQHSILDKIGSENRRLLPNTKNPLHIIDGPEYRYYIGIIDFFTLYELRQKIGRVLKSIKFCCKDHSTLPPRQYADRFVHFMVEHTE